MFRRFEHGFISDAFLARSNSDTISIIIYSFSNRITKKLNTFFLFYLPFLSSIHEKANCIAILWTGSPDSLGSCLFRGFYGPPVFHIKAGASRLVPCPRTQQANLPACSPQPSRNAERQAGKLRMPFFKVFWYDSTRGMNPWSTDCEAGALTTKPSRR